MNGKTARLYLPTPAYYHSHLPALLVTAPRPAWHENPHLCAKRDLKEMIPGSRMNINGHIVRRYENQARKPYAIGNGRYSLTEAVAYVCGDSGEAG
jgi:hypothetical protein